MFHYWNVPFKASYVNFVPIKKIMTHLASLGVKIDPRNL